MKSPVLVTLTLAVAMLFGAGSALAQGKARHAAKLNLTPEQKSQIQSIHQTQYAKIEELNKQSLTREQYRSQLMAIRQESRRQMDGVLTPDQRARMAERQQRRAKRTRKLAVRRNTV